MMRAVVRRKRFHAYIARVSCPCAKDAYDDGMLAVICTGICSCHSMRLAVLAGVSVYPFVVRTVLREPHANAHVSVPCIKF